MSDIESGGAQDWRVEQAAATPPADDDDYIAPPPPRTPVPGLWTSTPTTDTPSYSTLRAECMQLVASIPAEGLRETVESLSGIREFWLTEPDRSTKPIPAPILMEAVVIRTQESGTMTIESPPTPPEPGAIAAIRERWAAYAQIRSWLQRRIVPASAGDYGMVDVPALLAEVDRLRAALHNIDTMSAHMERQETVGGAACDREDVAQLGDMARAALEGR